MIIEDTEAFKSWLTTTLEPLCEADPEALSKYVFALVKKDKPVVELRASMVQQLDVFLQSETKKFVDLLFKTLETQVYTLPASTTVPSDNAVTTTVEQTLAPVAGKLPIETELTIPDSTPAVQLTAHQVTTTTSVSIPQTNGTISSVSAQSVHKRDPERGTHRKSDSDKDDKGRTTTRIRHRSSRSPSRGAQRSRSRSWDRSRRSRSRERDRTRDRSRTWRNKSPPNRRYDRDRRRSWSRSNSPNAVSGSSGGPSRTRSMGNSRSRSRSPRYNHRGRYRNRTPPLGRLTPSRSRSRTPADRSRDKKEPLSGAATPTQDSNHGDVDMRLTTTSQSIQSVVSAGGKAVPEAAPSTGPTLLSGIFNSKRRCRDFDEKGYCMRGDLCPYDHGNDPVVLEDTALSRVLAFPSHTLNPATAVPAAPGTAPPLPTTTASTTTEVVAESGGTVPVLPVEHHLQHPPAVPHHHMRGPHPGNMEYNPDAPSIDTRMMWGRGSFRGGPAGSMMRGAMGRPVAYNPQPQRELISVPVTDQAHQNATGSPSGYKRPRSQPIANANNYAPEIKDSPPAKKKSTFDFARLGPRNKNPNNCSLELKKVPRGLNNITHLNNHFSKFGKIVNIQVSYEGDPEAALVTFSSHAEANAAYRSTEAVLNNRFIKVFWHSSTPNNEGKQENVPPPRPSVKERLGVPNSISTNSKVLNTLQPKATQQQPTVEKVIMSGNNLTKTVYIPTALKKQENVATTPTSITTSTVQENAKVIAAVAAIKKTQEILAVKETLKKKQEEKRKEALKLTADLRKRKQELLDKQLAQQRALIERLEKGGVAAEQREEIMSTIKILQESIEKIRKDLANVVTTTANKKQATTTQPAVKKSKEEAQREILDAELDLFTKQQEGGDTTELQRKVAELKMEAHSLGLLQGPSHVKPHRGALHLHRGIHRGLNRTTRGSLSFRGRGRAFTHVSVDHRPTKVLVSGYEEDEKTEVLAHFAQFGEIVDYIADDSTPSLVLNYKSRKEAELAMLKGRAFQDRLLSVTWCSGQAPSRQLSVNRTSHSLMSTVHLHRGGHRSVVMVGTPNTEGVEEVDEGLMDEEELTGAINLDAELSEDVLLQDDEEEEEDGEDRSWRR